MLQILLFSFPFQLTPSRRATKSGSVLVLQWEFQLTPSRRATSGFFSVALIVFNFNSRPHGGRQGNTSVFHAGRHFNSRPHGGRRSSKLPHTGQKSFQLTPSRRATGRNAESGGSCNNFNSRPHGGRRFFKREINARFQFQLTPSRRATYARFITLSMSAISTHALTEGDRCTVHLVNLIEISTHALTEGDWTEQARED